MRHRLRSPRAAGPAAHRPGAGPGLIAAAVCTLFVGLAHAEEASDERAAALLAQQDAAGAYALLVDQESRRAGDPRFDSLLGVAALDSGHVSRAIFAFERVLAVRPDDAPARAELGRALLAAGELDAGRTELIEARRAPMPEAAAAAIDRVLGAMDDAAPARGAKTTGYLEIGGGHDSNVNSASNTGEFALPGFGGVVFAADRAYRRQSDQFAVAAAGVGSQLALDGDWSVLGSVSARGALNRRVHELDTAFVDASAGVRHASGANAQTVALQTNTAWVSSSVYRTANGLAAQWQSQFGPSTQASVFGQWSRQEYAGQAERNTDRAVLGTGAAHDVAALGTLGYGSVYAADERARHDGFEFHGHHALGLRLGVEQRAGARAVAFAEWQWERRRYGGVEPSFDVNRREHQHDVLAGVRIAVAPGWQLLPQVHWTRAASTVDLYQYRRTVVQLALRKEFP